MAAGPWRAARSSTIFQRHAYPGKVELRRRAPARGVQGSDFPRNPTFWGTININGFHDMIVWWLSIINVCGFIPSEPVVARPSGLV
jgi:hypothetical protein